MALKQRTHVVFSRTEAIRTDWETGRRTRIEFGVFLDLDRLEQLAVQATNNKGRKAIDGPVCVEIHHVDVI